MEHKLDFSMDFDIHITRTMLVMAGEFATARDVIERAISTGLPPIFQECSVEVDDNGKIYVSASDYRYNDVFGRLDLLIDFQIKRALSEWIEDFDADESDYAITIHAVIENTEFNDNDKTCYVSGHMNVKESDDVEIGTPVVAWCYNPAFAPSFGGYEEGIVKSIITSDGFTIYNVDFPEHTDPFGRVRSNRHTIHTLRVVNDENTVQDRKSELYNLFMK